MSPAPENSLRQMYRRTSFGERSTVVTSDGQEAAPPGVDFTEATSNGWCQSTFVASAEASTSKVSSLMGSGKWSMSPSVLSAAHASASVCDGTGPRLRLLGSVSIHLRNAACLLYTSDAADE